MSWFPIRDCKGTTQLVVLHKAGSAGEPTELFDVPAESVILVEGTVLIRPESQQRPGPAGQIEVQVERFVVLNPADNDLPFLPSDTRNLANDELRARYRYLDLRRSALNENLRKRSKVAQLVRNVLHDQDFSEIETPMLLKSSPEGAREFLVPSRNLSSPNKGAKNTNTLFYALPQSPQQPKQLLICSGGVDKYFQIAKCFRDEDGRKDRQPEFTQIDLEMAFVSWGQKTGDRDKWRIGGTEVRNVTEDLIRSIWKQFESTILPSKFEVMTYEEAMKRFGSDKPDNRFGLEISDITHLLPPGQRKVLESKETVLECLVVRKSKDKAFARAAHEVKGGTGVECVKITEQNAPYWLIESSLVREGLDVTEPQDPHVNDALQIHPGDYIWLAVRPKNPEGGSTALGRTRLSLSETAQARGHLKLTTKPHFLWITEFPLFTRADADKDFLAKGRWSSSHHPFTAPMWEDIPNLLNNRIASVRGQHYDLVLNGVEIGGGSVRVHDAVMQDFIFEKVLQLDDKEISTFDHLRHALKCGAPPHGGIALGFDRLMAVLCKTQSIRDVIAFPKTTGGVDLLFKSPGPVSREVLSQYGIMVDRRSHLG